MRKSKLTVKVTNAFRRDYKKAIKRGLDISLLDEMIEMLALGKPLPEKFCDHALSGNWREFRECHILPDWLLIYRVEEDKLILTLTRTGTHSDLFGQ